MKARFSWPGWPPLLFYFGLGLSTSIVVGTLLWLVSDIGWHGWSLVSWDFLTSSPSNAGRAGGIRPVLISTGIILSISLWTAVPIAVISGLLFSGRLFHLPPGFVSFRRSIDLLASVPSVVFGLFGHVFFGNYLGLGYSLLAGGLTLGCMILPLMTRLAEESFRMIPKEWLRSSDALGLSKTRCFWHILLPNVVGPLLSAVVISIGRALAETAALLFTSGYVLRDPGSILDSGRTLSIHIYDLAMNVSGGNSQAYGSTFVLMLLLLTIHLVAQLIHRQWRLYAIAHH
jgi:phosphate transport system permease protein